MDGSLVSDGEGLLKTLREAAAFAKARGEPVGDARYTPVDSDRDLIVPKDARLEALARRWMVEPDVSRRRLGIELLGTMPSPENMERLRGMLTDPVFEVSEEADWSPRLEERAFKVYPLRQAAARWLPAGEGQGLVATYLRYVPARWRGWAIGLGLIFAAAVLWPRRRWGEIGWGGRFAIVALGLMGIVVVLWCRSGRAQETYSFAGGGADYEVVSKAGRLGVLRVQDSAPPHGWMVRCFDAKPYGDVFWFAMLLTSTQESEWRGFYAAEGKTADAAGYSYRLIALPYWAVMAVVGAWPAAWGVVRYRRAQRRRRWMQANRCGRCGYDLRGHTGEGRCPECGEENAPRRGRRR
jgi:hypothetical protein